MRKQCFIAINFLQCGSTVNILKVFIIMILIGFPIFKMQAQLINNSKITIKPGSVVSVHGDYINTEKGEFKNDGKVYFFKNLKNNGKIYFTASQQGTTYFSGAGKQMFTGLQPALFKDIVFENYSETAPFQLGTTFEIAGIAYFKKGIINARDYGGKLVFAADASHKAVGNATYVNGPVLKKGISGFEFPVGSLDYYRPVYNDDSGYAGDRYSIRYFYKSTNTVYPHAKKEHRIKFINDAEYWIVNKEDQGSNHIMLSLTLHPDATPSYIYKEIPGTKIGIVRWDTTASRWISEGGRLDTSGKLVMTQLSGDGIVTLARIVADQNEEE